jgi:hypothetical protein
VLPPGLGTEDASEDARWSQSKRSSMTEIHFGLEGEGRKQEKIYMKKNSKNVTILVSNFEETSYSLKKRR